MRVYRRQLSESAKDWHDGDAHLRGNDVWQIIAKNGLQPKTVADIGCGAGGVLAELSKHVGPDVRLTGFDIAPQAIAMAAHRTTDNLKFVARDVLGEPMAEPVDVMLLTDVFEHIPDYLGFLETLRPQARHFVFHIPLDIFLLGILEGSYIAMMRKTWGHLHVFDKNSALMTLEDAGYRVVDWFYTQQDLDAPRWMHGLPAPLRYYPWRAWMKFRKVMSGVMPNVMARTFRGYNIMVLAESAT